MQLIRTQEVSISSQQETKYMERATPDLTGQEDFLWES